MSLSACENFGAGGSVPAGGRKSMERDTGDKLAMGEFVTSGGFLCTSFVHF